MKKYYINAFGDFDCLIELEADDLEEAISMVNDQWANSGKRKIIEKIYKLVEEKEHIVDTDW